MVPVEFYLGYFLGILTFGIIANVIVEYQARKKD